MGTLRFRSGILVFMIPAFVLYGIFFVVPFFRTIYFSFFNWNGFI